MDGSEKITPLVIGKSAKSRCFKGINSFPTKYRSKKKAWKTNELFNECSSRTRFDDYVLVDTDIAVWGALSDVEIGALDLNNTESDEVASEELTPGTLEPKIERGRWCDFLCYVEHGRVQYYRRGTYVNRYSFLFTSGNTSVGTALHIQEANITAQQQTKTHTERAAAGYMTTEKRAKRARFE
ncbi:hypothetical protein TNCV_2239771 [Trichonephila clavipes]|nr:hypothetical protein TNCV_2239771 [Trichonephila clavipes]